MTPKLFSLVELIVVLAILAILISLLNPSLQRVFKQSQAVECKMNLKSIYNATIIYSEDYNDHLPGPSRSPILSLYKTGFKIGNDGFPRWSDQFLQSYLANYLTTNHYSDDYRHIAGFSCPSNENITYYENPDLAVHYQLNTNNPHPFGKKHGSNANGEDSKKLSQLSELSSVIAIQDITSLTTQLPMHINLSKNTLHLDGSILAIEQFYPELE